VGGVFVAALLSICCVSMLGRGKGRPALIVPALLVGVLGAVVLAPWVYANLALHGDLYILTKLRHFKFFPGRTDSFLGRFAPFPYDPASVSNPGSVSTPYAEAQVSFPLFLLMIWNGVALWRLRAIPIAGAGKPGAALWAWAAGLSAGWFAFTAAISLSPALADLFSPFASYIQFPARFVNHSNLAMLGAVLASGFLVAGKGGYERFRTATAAVCAVAFAVALAGVCLKLKHGAFVEELAHEPRYAWSGDRSGLVTAGRLDAGTDYAAVKGLPQLAPSAVDGAQKSFLPVGAAGSVFGVAGGGEIDVPKTGWVVTNMVVFRWSRLLVNGLEWPRSEQAANEPRLALRLTPGHYSIRWDWRPDPIWIWMRNAAAAAYTVLFCGIILLAVRLFR